MATCDVSFIHELVQFLKMFKDFCQNFFVNYTQVVNVLKVRSITQKYK